MTSTILLAIPLFFIIDFIFGWMSSNSTHSYKSGIKAAGTNFQKLEQVILTAVIALIASSIVWFII
jgi:hypothetical protein